MSFMASFVWGALCSVVVVGGLSIGMLWLFQGADENYKGKISGSKAKWLGAGAIVGQFVLCAAALYMLRRANAELTGLGMGLVGGTFVLGLVAKAILEKKE